MMKYLLNIALLLILVISMMPYKVEAATVTLIVDGDGSDSGGYYGGVPADWNGQNLDDGDTSYLIISGSPWKHSWSYSPCVVTSTINSVTFYFKAKVFDISKLFHHYVEIGGTQYSDVASPVYGTTSYVLYSHTWTTNPSNGLAWTAAAINSADFGINDSFSAIPLITYSYLVVDYVSTVPSVTTSAASTPTYSGGSHNITLNGVITSDGGAAIDFRGFAWSTTSNTTVTGNVTPPSVHTANWTEGASGIGAFSHDVGGLTKGQTYYYQAYAHNSVGWAWGDQMSFTMLNDPSISILPATNVSTTTARLNASVTSSGGQAAQVSFEYGTTASLDFTTSTANVTHNTGDMPYADILGLTALGTSYTYRARISNDVSSQVSGNYTFITEIGVAKPNSLTGTPTATAISLAWVKGSGSNKTLVRYKLGSYPTSTTDASSTLAYFGVETSKIVTGLAIGTTYYIMAWGETSGIYSTSNSTLIVTTLAGPTATDTIAQPATPTGWFQAPDYTNMSNMPFYPIVNFAADAFEVPKSTVWYMCALFLCVAVGIIFYSTVGNSNLFLSVCAVGVMIIVCSLIKLVPMWQILPFAVFAAVGIFVGERR